MDTIFERISKLLAVILPTIGNHKGLGVAQKQFLENLGCCDEWNEYDDTPTHRRICKSLERRGIIRYYKTYDGFLNVLRIRPKQSELAMMLQITDNTGGNIVDSGGYGGRMWQRNQTEGFEKIYKRPEISFEWDVSGDTLGLDLVSVDIVSWSGTKLHLPEDKNTLFELYCNLADNESKDWLELAQEFPDWFEKTFEVETAGIYGDGAPFTGYTYNEGDCLLSQDIHYTYITVEADSVTFDGVVYDVGGEWFIVSTHNGVDARWGFSFPVVYEGLDELSWTDWKDCTVTTDSPNDDCPIWDSYDGGHSFQAANTEPDIFELPLIDFDDDENIQRYGKDPKPYRCTKTPDMFGEPKRVESTMPDFIPDDTNNVYHYDGVVYFGGFPLTFYTH